MGQQVPAVLAFGSCCGQECPRAPAVTDALHFPETIHYPTLRTVVFLSNLIFLRSPLD